MQQLQMLFPGLGFQELVHPLEHLVAGRHRGQSHVGARPAAVVPAARHEPRGLCLPLAHRGFDDDEPGFGHLFRKRDDRLLQRPRGGDAGGIRERHRPATRFCPVEPAESVQGCRACSQEPRT